MTIATKFNPAEIESQWYKHWMEKKYFNSKPDNREPYTVIPPQMLQEFYIWGIC